MRSIFSFSRTRRAASPSAIDGGDSHPHTEEIMDLLLHFVDRSKALTRAAVVGYLPGEAATWSQLSGSTFAFGLALCPTLGLSLTLQVVIVTVARAKLPSHCLGHKGLAATDTGLFLEWS